MKIYGQTTVVPAWHDNRVVDIITRATKSRALVLFLISSMRNGLLFLLFYVCVVSLQFVLVNLCLLCWCLYKHDQTWEDRSPMQSKYKVQVMAHQLCIYGQNLISFYCIQENKPNKFSWQYHKLSNYHTNTSNMLSF